MLMLSWAQLLSSAHSLHTLVFNFTHCPSCCSTPATPHAGSPLPVLFSSPISRIQQSKGTSHSTHSTDNSVCPKSDPSLESRVSWKDTTKQTPGLFLPRLLALVPHLQAASCLGDLTSQWLLNPSSSLQVYCQRISPSHSPGLDHGQEAALYQVSLHPCNPFLTRSQSDIFNMQVGTCHHSFKTPPSSG